MSFAPSRASNFYRHVLAKAYAVGYILSPLNRSLPTTLNRFPNRFSEIRGGMSPAPSWCAPPPSARIVSISRDTSSVRSAPHRRRRPPPRVLSARHSPRSSTLCRRRAKKSGLVHTLVSCPPSLLRACIRDRRRRRSRGRRSSRRPGPARRAAGLNRGRSRVEE